MSLSLGQSDDNFVAQEVLFGAIYIESQQSALVVVQRILGNLYTPYIDILDLNSRSCQNGEQLKDTFQITMKGKLNPQLTALLLYLIFQTDNMYSIPTLLLLQSSTSP